MLLKEARNVKFANFVLPGQVLTVTAEIIKQDEGEVQLKTSGVVGTGTAVVARLVLEAFNLADERPEAPTDVAVRRKMREQRALIYQPATSLAAGVGQPVA